MPAAITRRLVSLTDALAVSTRRVRRYISDSQLDAVRLGRKTLRIKVVSIERFNEARTIGNCADSRFRSSRRAARYGRTT